MLSTVSLAHICLPNSLQEILSTQIATDGLHCKMRLHLNTPINERNVYGGNDLIYLTYQASHTKLEHSMSLHLGKLSILEPTSA